MSGKIQILLQSRRSILGIIIVRAWLKLPGGCKMPKIAVEPSIPAAERDHMPSLLCYLMQHALLL